jgi:hypothetical protein
MTIDVENIPAELRDARRPEIYRAAIAALENGISVVPPAEDGTKRPLPDGNGRWKRFQERPPDREDLGRWYGPRTGMGFVLGAVSGGLEVLEFDDRETYERFKEAATATGLAELVGRIEAGYLEVTPGGGVHWPYRCSEIRGNTKLAQRPGDPDEEGRPTVECLIETRGEGGFVVVAPTFGSVHPTGNAYRLIRGGVGTIADIEDDEREALWDLARSFDEMPAPEPDEGHRPRGNNRIQEGEIRPGEDFNRRATWEEILDGWTRAYSRGDVTYWRRPGKDRGVSATTGHCKPDLLRVFSTSTAFGTASSYSKFGAYARLHHGGDYGAAAKALAEGGYGTYWDADRERFLPNPRPKFKPRPKASGAANGAVHRVREPAADGPPERLPAGPGETPWDEPILEASETAEPFPYRVFPPALADFALEASRSLTCPIDYMGVAQLVIASAAIGRSVAITLKEGWSESPALYAALVGEPGLAKTPPLAVASRPLWAITEELIAGHRILAKEARNDKQEPPPLRRIAVDDSTVEAMGPILRDNSRGVAMIKDELTSLFMGMNQYKSGGKGSDRQFFLSAWSGSPVTIDRKSNPDGIPIHIPHPFLSIVGALTPGMLGEVTEAKGRDDGFLDRMLFAQPETVRVRWQPGGIPPELALEWENAVRRLFGREMVLGANGRPRPYFVRLSAPASDAFSAWFDAHCEEAEDGDFPAHMKGAWSKFRAYCARLALVLYLLDLSFDPAAPDPPPPLPAHCIHNAICLIDYFKNHARRARSILRGAIDENSDGRAILAWVNRKGLDSFTERDAKRNFPGRFANDPRALAAALEWLVARRCVRPGVGTPKAPGTPGRAASPSYDVNPDLAPACRNGLAACQNRSAIDGIDEMEAGDPPGNEA